jgi:hypothetical protein
VLQCENAPEHRAIAWCEPEQRIYQDSQAALVMLRSGAKNAVELCLEFLFGSQPQVLTHIRHDKEPAQPFFQLLW